MNSEQTPSTTPIVIQSKIELSEYRRLMFFMIYSARAFVFIHFMLVVAAVAMYYDERVGTIFGAWAIVPFVAFLIFLPAAIYYYSAVSYRANNKLHEPLTCGFNDVGITIKGTSFNTEIPWPRITKIQRRFGWILMRKGAAIELVIARNSFASDDDFDAVVALSKGDRS